MDVGGPVDPLTQRNPCGGDAQGRRAQQQLSFMHRPHEGRPASGAKDVVGVVGSWPCITPRNVVDVCVCVRVCVRV